MPMKILPSYPETLMASTRSSRASLLSWKLGAKPPSSPTAVASRPYFLLISFFKWWYSSLPILIASEKQVAPVGRTMNSCMASLLPAWLQVEFFTTSLQSIKTNLGPARKVNMNRCSHTSTKIGWARVNVTILLVKAEVLSGFLLDRFLNSLDTLGKSFKDSLDISSLLHGDDAELIFLINPGEEGLCVVVEDATTLGPVSLHTSNLEVSISRHKQEVIINQLLSNLLIHSSQRIVGSRKISLQVGKGLLHQLLNSNTLLLGNSGGKTKSVNGATDSDTARVNWNIAGNISLDFA